MRNISVTKDHRKIFSHPCLRLCLQVFHFLTLTFGLRFVDILYHHDFNMILQLLLGLAVAWLLYSRMALAKNLRRAQAIDFPLLTVPVSPMNVFWIEIEPLVFRIIDSLPFSLGTFGRYGRRGWHFLDKAASHLELGDSFALVTRRETFLHICDPDAINDVFARRQDFVRPI